VQSSDRGAGSDGVQHANCPAKSYYFPATREAGLVQIANALSDHFLFADKNGAAGAADAAARAFD
jgi:hypothetical protein